jgi:tetratricopeptide (TPR) repeat protein
MQASMLLERDPAAAAVQAGEILGQLPDHQAAQLLLAAARRRLGEGASALGLIRSLAEANPDSAVLKLELARCFVAAGNRPEALASLRAAVGLNPNLAEAWRELAGLHFAMGDTLNGDRAYFEFSRLSRDPPELTDAVVALNAGRFDTAEKLVRIRLREAPGDGNALYLLANVALKRGDQVEAERLLEQCLAQLPGHPGVRHDLAKLLHEQERSEEALAHIARLRAQDPQSTSHRVLEVQALRLAGRSADALVLMRQLNDEQLSAENLVILGNLLRELGRQAEAIAQYRRAIELQPGYAEAYWALANLKTYRLGDEDVEALRAQIALSGQSGNAGLHFALGKSLEDRADFAEAFEHYVRGNALKRAELDYDAEATAIYAERCGALYSGDFFAARSGWGSTRNDPIFIVGLPRSGSTLLEQMLASHPSIDGTHELPDVPLMALRLAARSDLDRGVEYPERLGLLPKEEFESMASRYLARTQQYRSAGTPFFVDKMLGNFSHLGLIHLMFPRALIIDARRHPMACAFSCYKQHFSTGMNFSYELGELAGYLKHYARLLEQFDQALPGRIHRVYYEKLVADPRGELERVLKRCGLPFDEACLRFYENPRVVKTISSEQVRRPLYGDSLEQWRNFEAWLGPLAEELRQLIADYPF